MKKKYLFLDRDGTLIYEPEDKQVDDLSKLRLLPHVIPSLIKLKQAGYRFVMISNQDGLGTNLFPEKNFKQVQDFILHIFESQGIYFEDIRICPHLENQNCFCRKPKLGLVLDYLIANKIDLERSFVIGDRKTDTQLAQAMGIKSHLINQQDDQGWKIITNHLLFSPRTAKFSRKTNETNIECYIELNNDCNSQITTGIPFLDHMLEQLAKHAGFYVKLHAIGDLLIDDHHTVEDCAIALGTTIRTALGDKIGINRFGFLLPMDDALAQIAIDLCGRSFCKFDVEFKREKISTLATEMIPHFFRSFTESLKAVLHVQCHGENTHHMIEAIFKGVGRCLRQAITKISFELPSTKGML